jgi:hypothetical protein
VGEKIRIDVLIPKLDPDYAYPHLIPVKEAKRGFRLSDENFLLISAGRYRVKLKKAGQGTAPPHP